MWFEQKAGEGGYYYSWCKISQIYVSCIFINKVSEEIYELAQNIHKCGTKPKVFHKDQDAAKYVTLGASILSCHPKTELIRFTDPMYHLPL